MYQTCCVQMISMLLILLAVSFITFVDSASLGNNRFICKSGAVISVRQVCDGKINCYDGSDESSQICERILCSENTFKCDYGACIEKSKKCNGVIDCVDQSDEMQCGKRPNSCRENEYRCKVTGQCILASKLCDGQNDCIDGTDEDKLLCDNKLLCPINSFRCTFGGCIPIDAQCDGFIDCLDGSDETNYLCLYRNCTECRENIKCSPIKSSRIDVRCKFNNEIVACNHAMSPGTIAEYYCKDYFIPINDKHTNNYFTICQQNGVWSHDILECKPNCGKFSAATPLIVNGWNIQTPFPWHINIYVSINNEYRYWCGGTLISEAVVLTAAHCVWNIEINKIKITIGSLTNGFSNDQLSEINEYSKIENYFIQYYNIRRIILHPLYLDKYGNYGSDIAVLEILGNVEFSDFILPACIDWDLDDITSHLSDQSVGIVMGMGITENNVFSNRLRATTLPVISNKKCIEKQNVDFKKFITFTTFCAGWDNGTSVCNGDSGEGLFFHRNSTDQWCLQGIVSLSPRRKSSTFCDPHQYTILTKVGIYVKWLRNILLEIHSKHNFTVNEHHPIF